MPARGMLYRKRPKSSHSAQTKRSCDPKKLVAEVAFSRNKDKDGSFKNTISLAANEIPSVSGKGGLNSAYPSDSCISHPREIAFPYLTI